MQVNKAVQITVEPNKVGREVITGRIYYVDGETLLRSRGGFVTLEGRLFHGGDYIT